MENCPNIIVACAVLHNIAIELKEEAFSEVNEEGEDVADPVNRVASNVRGNAVRHSVVEQYFRQKFIVFNLYLSFRM